MWVSVPLLFVGFVTGLLLVSVYEPAILSKKMLPDVNHPDIVMKRDDIDNGCYRLRPLEVPCPAESDSMNLLSLQHKG
jgi:hypothetical protein